MVSGERVRGLTGVTVVTATWLEAVAAWSRLRRASEVRVARVGIGGSAAGAELVVGCGLAGGVDPRLRTGTVVIPDWVEVGGRRLTCDADLAARLRAGAGRVGVRSVAGGLGAVGTLVTGAEREAWFERGVVAVDMESGRLAGGARRFAAVRVLLDTPASELSPSWQRAADALLDPRCWLQVGWLAAHAPACALLAAAVVAEGLRAG